MGGANNLTGAGHPELRAIAAEALEAFAAIASAARADLGRRGVDLTHLAVVNQATAEATARQMRQLNDRRIEDSQRLRQEPAIARLVIVDEDENREVLYISSSGTVQQGAVAMCSYMSPKGQLAPLAIGDYRELALPGGRRAYEVVEKLTFRTTDDAAGWDSRPAVQYRDRQPPLTIRSLRELLREDGLAEQEIDEVEAWLNEGEGTSPEANVTEGIRRDALTAMQLRVAPILNEFQDRIFRLPIDSQIAVLGPPGTGKTTTLVRRLRQKVDFAYLDPDQERPLVEDPDAAGLSHADSWLMFTPTELLRLYVKEAFGKEGVPVHDERIRTWDDYRREIGRRTLRILRTGTGSGLVLRNDDALLLTSTLVDQISWYTAFQEDQRRIFVNDLQGEAARIAESTDEQTASLGREIADLAIRYADRPLLLLAELAVRWGRLRSLAGTQRAESRIALREPLRSYSRAVPSFLAELTRFVEELGDDTSDDGDEEDPELVDDDDASERGITLRGARLAEDLFVRAMRARAIAQASGRSPAAGSKAGRLLAWISGQGLSLPDLKRVGAALLVQRAAVRLARAPADYLAQIPLRYRRFRRRMREQGQWYTDSRSGPLDASYAEVDLIMLAMLHTASAMERDRVLMQRLADRVPSMLGDIARLRRHQILADEATDFSPLQLACMRSLADPKTGSFYISGDFNQRLTRWGSSSEEQLHWACPGLTIEPIDISYRQSRKLADFARALAGLSGYQINDRTPDHIENQGWEPVFGPLLSSFEDQARWLSARVREIDRLTDGLLPTIAILVADGAALDPLADMLSCELEDMNIRAVACPRGLVKGQPGDVRIFEVEHIKGLEFEAVFFMDIDGLNERSPDLFDRFIYVGATRAATFLGLCCSGDVLPAALPQLEGKLRKSW